MKVLVVDDEPLARRRLEAMLGDLQLPIGILTAANGAEAVTLSQAESPDIVLLDIRMPGMDGLEAARHVARLTRPPAVIFTTAYDRHALAAFEANAVDYLLKPVKRERLESALAKARVLRRGQVEMLRSELGADDGRTHLSAMVNGRLRVVPVAEVLCLRADSKYTEVIWSGEPVLLDDSLKQLEQSLGARFVRVHRNALVRTDAITELGRDVSGQAIVRLNGMEEPVPVARRHVARLRALLK